MRVIAEHVEEAALLEAARHMGFVQGFELGPQPLARVVIKVAIASASI